MINLPWVKFAAIVVLLLSLASTYGLYKKNSELTDKLKAAKKETAALSLELELQKQLTEDALSIKQREIVTTDTVTKYVDRVDRIVVKENPELAIDANRLWQEALKDE